MTNKPTAERISLMADVYSVFKTIPERREQCRRILLLFMDRANFRYMAEVKAISRVRLKYKFLPRYK